MPVSKENREFIESLVKYYISTAPAYRDLARVYEDASESLDDVALGMIAGSIYSSFMQIYQNQHTVPDLGDMDEFNEIMSGHAREIRNALISKRSNPPGPGTDTDVGQSGLDTGRPAAGAGMATHAGKDADVRTNTNARNVT